MKLFACNPLGDIDATRHDEIINRLRENLPALEQRINADVATILAIVRRCDPIRLMLAVFWRHICAFLDQHPEESRCGSEQLVATRCVSYVSKLIAGAECHFEGRGDPTEQDLDALWTCVEQIHLNLMMYFAARTAKLRELPTYNEELDEFRVQAEMFWSAVSGDRYAWHQRDHLGDLLLPHDAAFKRLYGTTAEAVIEGATRLLVALTHGPQRAKDELHAVQAVLQPELNCRTSFLDLLAKPTEAMNHLLDRYGLRERLAAAVESFFGLRLFDVSQQTLWPGEFITDLSISPADDLAFVNDPIQGGWPTRRSAMVDRPFIRWQGRSYIFDQHGFCDNLYGAIRRAVLTRDSKYQEQWNAIQKRATETAAMNLLLRLLPGSTHFGPFYYRAKDATGSETWCECDGLVIYDDHAIILEVKAGAFTPRSPTVDAKAHLQSLAKLAVTPIRQGRRFAEALRFGSRLEINKEPGQPIASVIASQLTDITVCAVTLEQLTEHLPRIEHTKLAGLEAGPPAWPISLDDLRVVADIVNNPLIFLHFLNERKRAFGSPFLKLDDELDHLGLYLAYHLYVDQAAALHRQHPNTHVAFGGYRDEFDRYYHQLWAGEAADPPRPTLPKGLSDLLLIVAESGAYGRTRLGQVLLDTCRDEERGMFWLIAQARTYQVASGHPRPLSSIDPRFTIFVEPRRAHVTKEFAVTHTAAVMALQNESERTLVLLEYSGNKPSSVEFIPVTSSRISRLDRRKVEVARTTIEASRRKKQ